MGTWHAIHSTHHSLPRSPPHLSPSLVAPWGSPVPSATSCTSSTSYVFLPPAAETCSVTLGLGTMTDPGVRGRVVPGADMAAWDGRGGEMDHGCAGTRGDEMGRVGSGWYR